MALLIKIRDEVFARKPVQMTPLQRRGVVVSSTTALATFLIGVFFSIHHFFIIGGSFLFVAFLSLISIRIIYARRIFLATMMMLIPLWVTFILLSFFINTIGPMVMLITIIHALLVAAVMLEGEQSTLVLLGGIIISFAVMVINTVEIQVPGFVRISSTVSLAVINGILISLLLLFGLIFAFRFINLSLQIKLLASLLVISILPLGVSHFINTNTSRTAARQQAKEIMLNAAQQSADSFDTLVANKITEVDSLSQVADLGRLLDTPSGETPTAEKVSGALNILAAVQRQSQPYGLSYALIAIDGRTLADTDPGLSKVDESKRDYFIEPLKSNLPYVSEIEFEIVNNANRGYIYFSAPVRNSMFKVVGIVRARFDLTIFNETASRNMNIAQNGSFPILFGENLLRLADPYGAAFYKLVNPLPEGAYQPLIDAKKLPNLPIATLYTDLPLLAKSLAAIETAPVFTGDLLNNGTQYIGAAAAMTRRPWIVAYFQEEDVFLKSVETNLRNNQLNIALLQFVANILVLIFTTLLVRPISNLTTAAQKLAEGDLTVKAEVKSGDEVQTLAESFNIMTGQIRVLVSDLEGRVQERTVELAQQTAKSAFRVVQLQAVADVARTVASVKDLEGILTAVTQLVTERFSYYHAGIFLVDEKQDYAVLRAASSEGGARMLARGHKLLVGQVGIVGYVAATGKSRIATDVGVDAMFFNNPDLPLTRSEMALPLSSEGKVIGVLDIQSTEANAFTEDDISLFLILADQVSVAIVNNRLLVETNRALLEAQALHNQYLSEEWQKRTDEQEWQGYHYSLVGLKPSPLHSNPQIEAAIQSGEPCATTDENENINMLAIPIKVRGQVIGVIDMQQADHRPWHEDEIGLAQAIADQVGTALENARLLDQTLRRAQRERRALDITNKIRAVNDPQTMIQVALTELQKSLGVSQAQIVLQTGNIDQQGNGWHGNGKD